MAFALGVVEEFCRTIAASNGMKTSATTDPNSFYVKMTEPGQARHDMIKTMFESFEAAAKAQENGKDN